MTPIPLGAITVDKFPPGRVMLWFNVFIVAYEHTVNNHSIIRVSKEGTTHNPTTF
jgi:hypothetical protein